MAAPWLIWSVYFVAISAQAALYQWTDEAGQIHFSDTPQDATAQRITPSKGTILESRPIVVNKRPTAASQDKAPRPIAWQVKMTSPKPGHTYRNNQGKVSFVASIPHLPKDYQLELRLNGNVQATVVNALQVVLTDLPRGEYQAQWFLRNAQGDTLAQSALHTFYMQRPLKPQVKAFTPPPEDKIPRPIRLPTLPQVRPVPLPGQTVTPQPKNSASRQ